jgi:hypothetical protein
MLLRRHTKPVEAPVKKVAKTVEKVVPIKKVTKKAGD